MDKRLIMLGAGVVIGVQLVMIRELVRTRETMDSLHGLMLFNLQREFQDQVDEEFVNIVEKYDDHD
jgi:hypothetical protein